MLIAIVTTMVMITTATVDREFEDSEAIYINKGYVAIIQITILINSCD